MDNADNRQSRRARLTAKTFMMIAFHQVLVMQTGLVSPAIVQAEMRRSKRWPQRYCPLVQFSGMTAERLKATIAIDEILVANRPRRGGRGMGLPVLPQRTIPRRTSV